MEIIVFDRGSTINTWPCNGSGSGLTGKLRICSAVTFARIHLMPRIPEFLARHPDLEMEVVLDDRSVDLVQEGIDVALRMGRLARRPDGARSNDLRATCSCCSFSAPSIRVLPGMLVLQFASYAPRFPGFRRRSGLRL
jgi:DNA-binding transcriptional LysR family regulator